MLFYTFLWSCLVSCVQVPPKKNSVLCANGHQFCICMPIANRWLLSSFTGPIYLISFDTFGPSWNIVYFYHWILLNGWFLLFFPTIVKFSHRYVFFMCSDSIIIISFCRPLLHCNKKDEYMRYLTTDILVDRAVAIFGQFGLPKIENDVVFNLCQ